MGHGPEPESDCRHVRPRGSGTPGRDDPSLAGGSTRPSRGSGTPGRDDPTKEGTSRRTENGPETRGPPDKSLTPADSPGATEEPSGVTGPKQRVGVGTSLPRRTRALPPTDGVGTTLSYRRPSCPRLPVTTIVVHGEE